MRAKGNQTGIDWVGSQGEGIARMERALLGTCLDSTRHAEIMLSKLRREHIYSIKNVMIFDAISTVYEADGIVSLAQVVATLEARKQLEQCDGITYLSALLDDAAPFDPVIKSYCYKLKTDAQRRSFEVGAVRLQHLAESPHNSIDEQVQSLRDATAGLIADDVEPNGKPTGNDVREAIDFAVSELHERLEGNARPTVKTGIKQLDDLTTGFHPGELIILAARPGAGKTAAALSFALHAASTGQGCLFFSLEMPLEQLWYRALSNAGSIPLQRFRDPKALTPSDFEGLTVKTGELGSLPLWFDCTASITVEEITIRARSQKKDGLGLIVVDYMQLVNVPGAQYREQEVAHVSRTLKRLALDLNVPVVALSQLNRQIEHRTNRTPQLSDLRESGSIEQDADAVIFVHRPAMWDDTINKEEAELIISKQRNGPLGAADVRFVPECARFESASWEQTYTQPEREAGRQGETGSDWEWD